MMDLLQGVMLLYGMQLAPAAGGFGLGQIVGSLYEKEAQKEGPGASCYGPHCFRYGHPAASCLLSIPVFHNQCVSPC